MTNSFDKPEGEKPVVDTDFELRDDGVYAREVYEDGVGDWERIYENPADSEGSRKAYKNYRRQKGVREDETSM